MMCYLNSGHYSFGHSLIRRLHHYTLFKGSIKKKSRMFLSNLNKYIISHYIKNVLKYKKRGRYVFWFSFKYAKLLFIYQHYCLELFFLKGNDILSFSTNN